MGRAEGAGVLPLFSRKKSTSSLSLLSRKASTRGDAMRAQSAKELVHGVRRVGQGICQHARIRSRCKECGGAESASTRAEGASARSAEGQHLPAHAQKERVQ